MKDIAIYGAGGFGREVACLIHQINVADEEWNFIGFFDDGKKIGDSNEYGKIIGGINELNSWDTPINIVLAMGNPKLLDKISEKISNQRVEFPNIISSDTIWLDRNNVRLGKGNIICCRCFISCNVTIGDFNIFNNYITIGHDVKMGNCNSLMPATRISGEVNIGNNNFFGVDSVVLQQLKIGNNTVIGANSTIVTKTKDGFTYIGNPATKFEF